MLRHGLAFALVLGLFLQATTVATATAGRLHVYYISADEVTWDYVPSGTGSPAGKPHETIGYFADPKGGPVVSRPVSTTYRKCLYREYTDGSFHTLKPRTPRWQHLGFFGPLIRAEVGDSISIVYRNACSFPSSIHVHGLQYAKTSEGAPYNDGTRGGVKSGDSVAPGKRYTYTYRVPERAGPGPNDPNSIMWMYHSHTDESHDVDSGLMGPIVITARGQAKPDGTPKGVDREFVVWFAQIHEERSWYVKHNLPTIAEDHVTSDPNSENFYPYFVPFSINGYTYGSLPVHALTMHKGEQVRWYLMAGQGDYDFHTPHWTGNTVTIGGSRTDSTAIAPMQMVVADMVPDSIGTWLLRCHVGFHNEAGMNVHYVVEH